jgi:hypothetical protein
MSTGDEALGKAQWLVGIYKTPLQRARAVVFTPFSDPATLYASALGNELLTRVKLVRRPKDGSSSTFTQESLIEGIEHDATPGYWQTTWRLSPTAALNMFILDDSVSGVLDDPNSLLGY